MLPPVEIWSATDGWIAAPGDFSRRGWLGCRRRWGADIPVPRGSGDVKPVGEGISEMRIDVGPGYRAYFTLRGNAIVILLCGGDKKTQQRDIKHAAQLAKEV